MKAKEASGVPAEELAELSGGSRRRQEARTLR